MYDLNNWLRRDTQPSTVYYGYSTNTNPSDTDPIWTIMQVSTVGTVDSVKWSNGMAGKSISKWSDRVSSFQPPATIGLTYSHFNTPYSSNVSISIGWSASNGTNAYHVLVRDQAGRLFSDNGYQIQNTGDNLAITSEVVNNNSYVYKYGAHGTTYSVTVIGTNASGSTSSTVSIGV